MMRKVDWLAKVRMDGQGENLKAETTSSLIFTEFSLANRATLSTFGHLMLLPCF